MVSNVSLKPYDTINIRPPKEYAKYEYEVEIDGKKQMASVEKTPDDKVTIKVGDGEDTKIIKTDVDGLMEFNKNYKPKDILYNKKPTSEENNSKEVYSGKLAQIMKNIALANIAIQNRMRNNNFVNQQFQQQVIQDNMTALQMHQQATDMAMQAHNTAVQMSTPGMGII